MSNDKDVMTISLRKWQLVTLRAPKLVNLTQKGNLFFVETREDEFAIVAGRVGGYALGSGEKGAFISYADWVTVAKATGDRLTQIQSGWVSVTDDDGVVSWFRGIEGATVHIGSEDETEEQVDSSADDDAPFDGSDDDDLPIARGRRSASDDDDAPFDTDDDVPVARGRRPASRKRSDDDDFENGEGVDGELDDDVDFDDSSADDGEFDDSEVEDDTPTRESRGRTVAVRGRKVRTLASRDEEERPARRGAARSGRGAKAAPKRSAKPVKRQAPAKRGGAARKQKGNRRRVSEF